MKASVRGSINVCGIQSGLRQHHTNPLLSHNERLNVYEETENVCLVWPCWLLGFGVVWCCAVTFPGGS